MKPLLIIFTWASFLFPCASRAQGAEAQQLLLNCEKLAQFKQILSDMKRGYTILESGYSTIRDISKGNFNLHKTFLDGLLGISPAVRDYKRTKDIISCQLRLLQEYKAAYQRFARDENFTAQELAYFGRVYEGLFRSSIRNLDELASIVTAGKLRMSDDERLQAIDRIYDDMNSKLGFLRSFNNDAMVLSLQRASVRQNIEVTKKLYGIN